MTLRRKLEKFREWRESVFPKHSQRLCYAQTELCPKTKVPRYQAFTRGAQNVPKSEQPKGYFVSSKGIIYVPMVGVTPSTSLWDVVKSCEPHATDYKSITVLLKEKFTGLNMVKYFHHSKKTEVSRTR